MTSIVEQQKEFKFVIEDDIPFKKDTSPNKAKTSPLNDAIYNFANKLNINQSFFLESKLFEGIKYPVAKINDVLSKLKEFHKKGGNEILFGVRTQKDEDKKVIGYRVWRLAVVQKS